MVFDLDMVHTNILEHLGTSQNNLMLNLGIYKHCKKKIWNKIQSLLFNIIQGGESSFLGEREREVFVSNLDGSTSHFFFPFLQVKILQTFLVNVLLIIGSVFLFVSLLHLSLLSLGIIPDRSAIIFSELVKLFFLILHLLVPESFQTLHLRVNF